MTSNYLYRMRYTCPCCGYQTLPSPAYGSYAICRVCFWQDDTYQSEDPDIESGANGISLRQAQENYLQFGASDEGMVPFVRSPASDEPRGHDWKQFTSTEATTFLRIHGIASKKTMELINTNVMKWPRHESSLILLIAYADVDIPIGAGFTSFLETGPPAISRRIEGKLIQVTQSWLKPFDYVPAGHKSIIELDLNEKGRELLSSKLTVMDSWEGAANQYQIIL